MKVTIFSTFFLVGALAFASTMNYSSTLRRDGRYMRVHRVDTTASDFNASTSLAGISSTCNSDEIIISGGCSIYPSENNTDPNRNKIVPELNTSGPSDSSWNCGWTFLRPGYRVSAFAICEKLR
jgi:hypothetical protein